MGVHSRSITAAVDPNEVWRRWTDVENWPADDPDIVKARLNGPLTKGAIGWIQPKGGLKTQFKLTQVDRQKMRFTLATKLPFAVLDFAHSLDREERRDGDEGPDALEPDFWVLTHTLTITGPLARLWDRIVGRSFAKGLPKVLDNIARAAAV